MAGDGDEAFPVHRAMMASSSDYFKAMFTGESAKPDQNHLLNSGSAILLVAIMLILLFVLDTLVVAMIHALISSLYRLPSCTVCSGKAFFIHEHIHAYHIILPP